MLYGAKGSSSKGSSGHQLPPELEGDERLRNIEPRMVELITNEVYSCITYIRVKKSCDSIIKMVLSRKLCDFIYALSRFVLIICDQCLTRISHINKSRADKSYGIKILH